MAQRKTRNGSNGSPSPSRAEVREEVMGQIGGVERTLATKIDVLSTNIDQRFDYLERLHEERRVNQDRRFSDVEDSVRDLEKDVKQGKFFAGAGGLLGGIMGWFSSKL